MCPRVRSCRLGELPIFGAAVLRATMLSRQISLHVLSSADRGERSNGTPMEIFHATKTA